MSDKSDTDRSDVAGDDATNHGEPTGTQEHKNANPQAGHSQSGQGQGTPQENPAQGEQQQAYQQQGGYQQGQQQVQTGPSLGDIFSRSDTLAEMKAGVLIYAILGLGIGLGMFGVTNSVTSGASGAGAAFAGGLSLLSLIAIPIVVGVVGALVLSRRQNEALDDVANNLVYATVGVTAFTGTIVTFLIAWILAGIGGTGVSFNGIFGPMILGALGAAVTGAGMIWADRSYLADNAVHPQQSHQYQEQ